MRIARSLTTEGCSSHGSASEEMPALKVQLPASSTTGLSMLMLASASFYLERTVSLPNKVPIKFKTRSLRTNLMSSIAVLLSTEIQTHCSDPNL